LTVLQPAKLHTTASVSGVFVLSISGACLALGLFLGVSLRGLDTATPVQTATYWQDKAAAQQVNKPVAVRYTSPDAIALKAELDEFKHNFKRYQAGQAAMRSEIFAGSDKIAATPHKIDTAQTEELSTPQLVGKITRVLLLDEVDSFLNKVQLVEEVRQHATQKAPQVNF